jgi:actin-like ATPase involved in cell morphogenesis
MSTITAHEVGTVKPEVKKIVAEGKDVRGRLSKVVSEAAVRCHEAGEGLAELVRSVVDGAREGLEKATPKDRENALRQVVDALGDGLSQTALATRLAVEEAASSSREYAEKDLVRLRDDLTAVRGLFAETVAQGLKTGKTLTKEQVEAAKTHAGRVADQMKPVVTEVVEAIRTNPAAFARESLHAGVSMAEGAGESLCKSLSRLLDRAGAELRQASKQKL